MTRSMIVLSCCFLVALLLGAPTEVAADDHRCVSDCECEVGEICVGSGQCEIGICPEVYDPVCGVDGMTYGNTCDARVAHVAVAYEGECGKVCGGIAGVLCPKGQICDLPPGQCRGADLQGECRIRPEDCFGIYQPVCGCNGKTYPNDCERLRAGVQKDHEGACEKKCKDNSECSKSEYCNKKEGDCGGHGTCDWRPEICPQPFDPVCGCDRRTYSNACVAASEGVSVAYGGECR